MSLKQFQALHHHTFIVSNKKIEFILDIFTCFIYAWSNKWLIINESDNDDIIDYSLELKQQMINKLDIYLKKLSNLTYWKQIQSKLIDWLILDIAYSERF